MRGWRGGGGVVGVAVAVLVTGCGERPGAAADTATFASQRGALVLGFLPSARAAELVPDAERLGAFLAVRLGQPVEVVVPTAYEPLLEGFRFGHVQIAFLDGGPGWIAHRRSGAEVILAELKDGATHYYAEAFVAADSEIETLEDLRGRRVAFTSRTGSSGFIMPVGSLIDAGIIRPRGRELTDLEAALGETFASTIEAGGYQQALLAVIEGRADVAFGAHDAPERFLSEEQRARVRTLHRFGAIPAHSIMVAGGLDSALVDRIRDALLELNDAANLPLLRAIYGVDGLVRADTETHLGDFGRALNRLPGMERTLLERRPS
jgi:phosphonate transport system substrate-binding protein